MRQGVRFLTPCRLWSLAPSHLSEVLQGHTKKELLVGPWANRRRLKDSAVVSTRCVAWIFSGSPVTVSVPTMSIANLDNEISSGMSKRIDLLFVAVRFTALQRTRCQTNQTKGAAALRFLLRPSLLGRYAVNVS